MTHQQDPKKTDYTKQPQSDIHIPTRELIISQPSSKRFREGACENCGSIAHKTKDCLERQRKIGAKHSNSLLVLDESIKQREMSFDTKRDRWRDYDSSAYKQVIENWDESRQEHAQRVVERSVRVVEECGNFQDPSTKLECKNLRVREDTAKYLGNLQSDSSRYDPKTRSMQHAAKETDFVGDDFVPAGKEPTKIQEMRIFAWECQKAGESNVHLQANPTLSEKKFNESSSKKTCNKKGLIEKSLLEKYGGEEYNCENPLL